MSQDDSTYNHTTSQDPDYHHLDGIVLIKLCNQLSDEDLRKLLLYIHGFDTDQNKDQSKED